MVQKLNEMGLAWSFAILAAIIMTLLWVGGSFGIYTEAFEQMQIWHVFFSLSFGGLIAGIIEAGIWSFLGGWLIAWFYNKFV